VCGASYAFEKGNSHLHYDRADKDFVPVKLAKIAIQIRGEAPARGLEDEEMNFAKALKRLGRPLPVTQVKIGFGWCATGFKYS